MGRSFLFPLNLYKYPRGEGFRAKAQDAGAVWVHDPSSEAEFLLILSNIYAETGVFALTCRKIRDIMKFVVLYQLRQFFSLEER